MASDSPQPSASSSPRTSPKRERLREFFDDLSLGYADLDEIDHLAQHLHVEAILLAGFSERRAYKAGQGGCAPVRSSSRGDGLERLRKSARCGSIKRWMAAWGGTDHGTHNAIIKHMGSEWRSPRYWPPEKRISFGIPGASFVAPRPQYCVEAIDAAVAEVKAIPGDERAADHLGVTISKDLVEPLTKFIEGLDSGISKISDFIKKWSELKDARKAADEVFKPDQNIIRPPDTKSDSYATVRKRMMQMKPSPEKRRSLMNQIFGSTDAHASPSLPSKGGAAIDPGDMGADKGPPPQTFKNKAPIVMHGLMNEFDLSKEEAAIVLGNLGHESAGFRQMQEASPWAGRGGWGWAQWTGPRRREFEQWAAENKLDPKSDEANYGFLMKELRGKYLKSIAALKMAPDWKSKMYSFEGSFEGAGVKAWGSRFKYAREALRAYDGEKDGGGSKSSAAFPSDWRERAGGGAFQAAREAGVVGSGPSTVKGSADLNVRITGGNANVRTTTSGDLFQDVSVNRGRSMPQAAE